MHQIVTKPSEIYKGSMNEASCAGEVVICWGRSDTVQHRVDLHVLPDAVDSPR